MPDRWEYRLLYRSKLKDESGVEHGNLSEALLNKFGQEGWEVASFAANGWGIDVLILKRRLPPTENPT